jgi:hypothetical protein
MRRALLGICWVSHLGLAAVAPAVAHEPSAHPTVDFRRDIRPLLSDKCFFCHGPDERQRQAGLRLDTRDGLFGERKSGRPVAAGSATSSLLWQRITHADPDQRMPPADSGKSLTREQVELVRRWIDEGAEWREHWAYVPPRRPPVPAVRDTTWPANEIDQFILARLERESLRPSPDADTHVLERRLHFDLIGLPPNVVGVGKGSSDTQSIARAQLVDSLLASPHFGERMAMYWLDLVRFADTVGYHGDQEHHISPYRDYVIAAFNDNVPFDRFTVEQLAGDLLPDSTIEQKVASGYNRLIQTSHEGGVQQKEYLAKYSADRVRNLASVWLGATMGCAECHDHKYDPFTQRDFYGLAAFFADVDDLRTFKGGDTNPTKREPELEVATRLAPDENRRTMITVAIEPRPIRVLARGDWLDESGEIVEPAVPAIFRKSSVHTPRDASGIPTSGVASESESAFALRKQALSRSERPEGEATNYRSGRLNRLDLARWLAARDNPLVARVFVNRLWKMYFGKGLAANLDDLGAQGEPPVHPELLDWLAVEFIDSGWDLKHMVRLMVASRTYRQASLETPTLRDRDPTNRLLARQSRPRLDAEMIRDAALATSGLLVRKIGGRSVRPYQPDGYYQHLNFPKRSYVVDVADAQFRRGLYTHWQRSFLHPMLKAFDAPSREECTAERSISNTPQAALVLLNDPTFVEAARAFALRILREGGATTDDRLRWAWRHALGREPRDREESTLRRLMERELAESRVVPNGAAEIAKTVASVDPDAAELAAWTSVARTIFNLNESITRN